MSRPRKREIASERSTGMYNGWANWETWNVALWINNDEGLYHMAREMDPRRAADHAGEYRSFAAMLAEIGGPSSTQTPDGVRWLDKNLDYPRLDEMMAELRGEDA